MKNNEPPQQGHDGRLRRGLTRQGSLHKGVARQPLRSIQEVLVLDGGQSTGDVDPPRIGLLGAVTIVLVILLVLFTLCSIFIMRFPFFLERILGDGGRRGGEDDDDQEDPKTSIPPTKKMKRAHEQGIEKMTAVITKVKIAPGDSSFLELRGQSIREQRPSRIVRQSENSTKVDLDELSPELCPICLCDFDNGERVCNSLNRRCTHRFHVKCMMKWLAKHDECPMCRAQYLVVAPFDDEVPPSSPASRKAPTTWP